MINLSYSTMNALINEPHTWLCKQMGLKTYTNKYMEEGKASHKIIQEHVCGKKMNEFLKDLPTFSVVEKEDFDKECKVEYKIDKKYIFHGFVDGLDPDRKDILEIKTGTPWAVGKFANLVQWKLYGLALPDYEKIWLVNTPRTPDLWDDYNIRVFNMGITEIHKKQAKAFIDKAIYVIEHIRDYNLKPEKKSNWCYYIDCPYCPKNEENRF